MGAIHGVYHGRGRTRHRFWGEYSADIAIQFETLADAMTVLDDPRFAGWTIYSVGKLSALRWTGSGEALTSVVRELVSMGAEESSVLSLKHSIDYGDHFDVYVSTVQGWAMAAAQREADECVQLPLFEGAPE